MSSFKLFDVDTIPQEAQADALKKPPPSPLPPYIIVPLPASNYVAGSSIFPSCVLYGYNAELGAYTSDSWVTYIAGKAIKYGATGLWTCAGEMDVSIQNK